MTPLDEIFRPRFDAIAYRALAESLRVQAVSLHRQAAEIDAFVDFVEAGGERTALAEPKFLAISDLAQLLGKSKEAIRKQAKRRGIAERINGQLYVRRDAAAHLYGTPDHDAASGLSSRLSALSNITQVGRSRTLDSSE